HMGQIPLSRHAPTIMDEYKRMISGKIQKLVMFLLCNQCSPAFRVPTNPSGGQAMSAFTFRFLFPLFILASAAAMTACEKNDGTFEEAGEDIDEAVDDAKDKVKDATN
ncbi:MAG TPA: hypothetical protein VET88_07595, partial [Gammaproteobacteria bacterium]|nr:hypothetical protein [Gammaproteobacteria bacterium]